MKNIWKYSGALGALSLGIGLAGCGGGNGGNNNPKGQVTYTQQERLARPVVNEVLATVAERRHRVNNIDSPVNDQGELSTDIESFLTFPADRDAATKNFIKSVLVPDVMKVDLTQNGEAAYLGLETGGFTSATGSTFGGRKLQDDVVDTSLGIVFGNTVTNFGVPDDGKEKPGLTTDNVDASGHNYSNTFPYLESPN